MSRPSWIRVSIGAASTLLVGMGLGRFSYAPMVPPLIESGTLTSAEAGLVGAMNLGGYIVGGLLTPWLRDRFPEPRVLIACLLVSELCLLASILPWGFAWLVLWRTLVGIAVAVMMILAISNVTRHAPPGVVGRATGIAFTGVGAGILLSGAALPVLLDISLEAAWAGAAAVGTLGVAVGVWGWSGVPAVRSPPVPPLRLTALDHNGARLVAAQAMFSIGLVPHSIWWIDYAVRGVGYSIETGGGLWILVGVGAVGGTFAWGRIAELVGFTRALVAVYLWLAIGIALPVLVPELWALVLSSLIFGTQPGLSAVIAGRAQQSMGSESMVALWRWMVLAVGLAQLLGGHALAALFEATGSYTGVFLIGAAAMALGAALCAGLRDRTA